MDKLHLLDMQKHRAKQGGMLQKMTLDTRHRLIGEIIPNPIFKTCFYSSILTP
ncbi:MAG: hypothetical protein ACO2XZ_05590 [Rickettsiales bacterium]